MIQVRDRVIIVGSGVPGIVTAVLNDSGLLRVDTRDFSAYFSPVQLRLDPRALRRKIAQTCQRDEEAIRRFREARRS